jgi:hypothetical protein
MTVPASISGCKAVCLRLSAFECLKWVNPRPIPQPASTTIRNDPSKVHPPTQPLHHVDVNQFKCRKSKYLNASQNKNLTVG